MPAPGEVTKRRRLAHPVEQAYALGAGTRPGSRLTGVANVAYRGIQGRNQRFGIETARASVDAPGGEEGVHDGAGYCHGVGVGDYRGQGGVATQGIEVGQVHQSDGRYPHGRAIAS